MDEKRARFTTEKSQEYGSTAENTHMSTLCKFKFQHKVNSSHRSYKAPIAAAVFPADVVKIKKMNTGT